MANFITTYAFALVAILGILLVACGILLIVSLGRRVRERNAVRQLLALCADEGRYSCDSVMSGFVHDLNNLILVLSMESERLEFVAQESPEVSRQIDILRQVVADGRSIVQRCRAQMSPVEMSSSNLCEELRVATELLTNAGFGDVDVTLAKAVRPSVTVQRPARDLHLLVLSLVRASRDASVRLPLTVSVGRDGSLPEDLNNSEWVSVSIDGCEPLPDDDARAVAVSRIARRLSGEVVLPGPNGRSRLVVSLPVVAG